jgi:hypothetical protein
MPGQASRVLAETADNPLTTKTFNAQAQIIDRPFPSNQIETTRKAISGCILGYVTITTFLVKKIVDSIPDQTMSSWNREYTLNFLGSTKMLNSSFARILAMAKSLIGCGLMGFLVIAVVMLIRKELKVEEKEQ